MTSKEQPAKGRRTSNRTRKVLKRIVSILLFAVVVAGVVFAALPKPVVVETADVRRGEFVLTVNEDGVSRVNDRYVVSAPLAGNLARLEINAGDEVKQGEVLARILPAQAPLLDVRSRTEAEARVNAALASLRQANAQIERSRVAADYAKEEAERTKGLVDQQALSRRELDLALLQQRSSHAELASAEFAAKVARHELEMARTALGRFDKPRDQEEVQFEVTSPITGRVLKVIQESEGVVQAGAPLLEVGDPSALEIAVDVLTNDAVGIRAGASTHIDEWGGPRLRGSVRLVEPSAFTRLSALGVEEQRVNAVIDLSDPHEKWKALGDGYRVEASIETYRKADAVLVPWSALFRRDGGWAVFVKDGERARLRMVQVGHRNESDAEITGGLEPGQVVILHPSDRVHDGVEVVVGAG